MATVDSIYVGRFYQNRLIQRITPPPAAQIAATPGAAGGYVPVMTTCSTAVIS